jgi:CRP/FNR family transcriptional regulator, cyclic AMP receptor protein
METQRLAAIPIFAGLPEDELAALAASVTEVEIAEGSSLTVEGELGHSIFIIEEGTGDVTADGVKIDVVEPGSVVGEVAVLASGIRTATIVATSPIRALGLFKRNVWALESSAPEASRRLRGLVAPHVAAVTDRDA